MTIVTVWIAPPQEVDGQFATPWTVGPQTLSDWTLAPHLLAISTHRAARGRGEATIARLRDETIQEGTPTTAPDIALIPGLWVAICHGTGSPSGAMLLAEVDWWGRIETISAQPIAGLPDAIGTIRAVRPMHGIAGQRASGWAWRTEEDGSYGEAHNTPPTANVSTGDGPIVGNGVIVTDENVPDASMAEQMLFTRGIDELSTAAAAIWTRWRLLRHLLVYVLPGAGPDDPGSANLPLTDIDIDDNLIPLLNDPADIEVHDLRPLTIDGALDMLIPDVLGLDYDLDLREVAGSVLWRLRIRSTLTDAPVIEYPLAKAAPHNLTAEDVSTLTIDEANTIATRYDAIRIVGAPILCCITVGNADANLLQGWSSAQQTEYATPAAGGTDEEIARRRAQPDLAHVGRRFLVQGLVQPYEIRTQEEPISGPADLSTGSGYTAPIISAVPTVSDISGTAIYDYASTTTTVDDLFLLDTISATPYMPTAALATDLPILAGTTPGTEDARPAESQARPEYLTPRLWLYDDSADTWTDLLSDDEAQTPRISVGAGSLAIDISYSRQEHLLDNLTAWDGQLYPELDWRQIAVTIALESDQRLEAYIQRDDALRPDRILTIDRPDLALWIIRRGTIIGLDADGTPLRATKDHAARNDAPTIRRLAELVAAWAFRPRRQLDIHHLDAFWAPAWATIGTVIGTIDDAGYPRTYNSPIKSITRSYQGQIGTTIATEAPAAPPTTMTLAGTETGPIASPAASAPSSWDLGASPAQAIRDLSQHARRETRDHRSREVRPPRAAAPADQSYLVTVLGGNQVTVQPNDTVVNCLKKAASKPIPLAEYDPAGNPPSGIPWPDGIGYGDMIVPGVGTQRVLLAYYVGAPTTLTGTVIARTPVLVQDKVLLTDDGAPPTEVEAWVIRHV